MIEQQYISTQHDKNIGKIPLKKKKTPLKKKNGDKCKILMAEKNEVDSIRG